MVKKAPPGDSISCYKSPHHISEPHYIRARITSVQQGPLQSAARYMTHNAMAICIALKTSFNPILCYARCAHYSGTRKESVAYFHFMLRLLGTCFFSQIYILIPHMYHPPSIILSSSHRCTSSCQPHITHIHHHHHHPHNLVTV